MKKLLLLLLCLPMIGFGQISMPEPLDDRYLDSFEKIGASSYTMYKEDHGGIFGNAAKMRRKVKAKAKEFAEKHNYNVQFVSQNIHPVGILGDWASFTYTFRLVNQDGEYVVTQQEAQEQILEFIKFLDSGVITKEEFDKKVAPLKNILGLNDNTTKKEVKKLTNISSLVDNNIPANSKVKNRYALVIGNEDYTSFQRTLSSEQNVDYAVNDATIFKKYCLNTLGVKEDNMNFLTNATAGAMNQKINKMLKLMNKLGNEAELIVYYAGHGYPDELTKVPYLIPVDVSGTDLSYAIKLEDLYRDLGNTNARVTIFLDACFTGGGRNSGLVASRGVKVKPKEGTLNGNIVVFSASSGEQSSLAFHKESHGMFTYYLLNKLQESKGKVSMGELADYITNEVSIQSININEKEQDPTVNTSEKVINDWRNWKF